MMRLAQLTCYFLAALGLVWSGWIVLQTQQVSRIRAQAEAIEHSQPEDWHWLLPKHPANEAATGDRSTWSCYGEKYKWRTLYHLYAAQSYLQNARHSAHLQALLNAKQSARQRILCQPADAKAWLDYALIETELEGFSQEAEQALLQSARLSPNESWLAEWRIPFWVQFLPLTDNPDVKAAFRKDIDTIEHGFVWRKQRLYKKLGVSDMSELVQP